MKGVPQESPELREGIPPISRTPPGDHRTDRSDCGPIRSGFGQDEKRRAGARRAPIALAETRSADCVSWARLEAARVERLPQSFSDQVAAEHREKQRASGKHG